MKHKHRPDQIIFVMTYLGLLSLGALLGGLLVFVVIIPAIRDLGSAFRIGTGLMALLGILALLTGIVAVWAMIGLWQGKALGRALTLMLTAVLVMASALAIPILLLVGLEGIALYVPVTTAVFLLLTGGGVLWSLTRPSTRTYFQPNTG